VDLGGLEKGRRIGIMDMTKVQKKTREKKRGSSGNKVGGKRKKGGKAGGEKRCSDTLYTVAQS